jgi:hypothetical protein
MATFTITHRMRLDNVAVIQTLEATDIAIGQSITITGLGDGLDGTFTVLAVPTHLFMGVTDQGDYWYDYDELIPNQLLFADTGDDLDRGAASPFGTLTWTQTCTWITSSNVTEWLGISSATANDTAFITTCVSAANAWAYRRRVAAGYHDSLTSSPSGAVTLGTTMYAASLYRQRGAVDSFASFDGMSGGGTPTLSHGEIMRLLGINRAQVG